MMGRRRKEGKHPPQKRKKERNSIHDSLGNEENQYPVPDLNKTDKCH
jgi:hypothetical protein